MQMILILLLAVLAGTAYRSGGAAGYNTKYRDIGVPLCSIAFFWLLYGFSWWLVLVLPLQLGALSTYRYCLPKPKDYLWYHYALHGFFCGLACIPVAIYTGHWWLWIIRAIIMGALVGLWSHVIKSDVMEEIGRGVIILL